MLPRTCAASLDDAGFVRAAAMNREPRLANAAYQSHGPNAMLAGDTVYLYEGSPRGGIVPLFAVSVPDVLVAQRDAHAIQRLFCERDAACAAGAPWWMKPLGTG